LCPKSRKKKSSISGKNQKTQGVNGTAFQKRITDKEIPEQGGGRHFQKDYVLTHPGGGRCRSTNHAVPWQKREKRNRQYFIPITLGIHGEGICEGRGGVSPWGKVRKKRKKKYSFLLGERNIEGKKIFPQPRKQSKQLRRREPPWLFKRSSPGGKKEISPPYSKGKKKDIIHNSKEAAPLHE